MEQQNLQSTEKKKNGLQEVLYVLKKNILLILIITIALTAIGGVFAFLRKPDYVAEEQVLYSMGDRSDVPSDINTMNAYKETIMDFCDTGVVVDRANYYFYLYAKDGYQLDDFIAKVQQLEKKLKSYQDEIDTLVALKGKINDLIKLTAPGTTKIDSLIFQTEIEKSALVQQVLIIEHIRALNDQLNGATSLTESENIKKEIDTYENYLKYSKRSQEHVSAVGTSLPWPIDAQTDREKQIAYVNERVANIESSIENQRKSTPLYYSVDGQDRITEYIQAERVGVNEYSTDNSEQTFDFGITYLDNTEKTAKEKVKILVLAYGIESAYFFVDLKTTIEDMGPLPCHVDIEKSTIILISFALGLIVSLLVVYLIQVLDKTVKSKEEVEELTGYPVLACIETQEVEKS